MTTDSLVVGKSKEVMCIHFHNLQWVFIEMFFYFWSLCVFRNKSAFLLDFNQLNFVRTDASAAEAVLPSNLSLTEFMIIMNKE